MRGARGNYPVRRGILGSEIHSLGARGWGGPGVVGSFWEPWLIVHGLFFGLTFSVSYKGHLLIGT